MPNTRKILIVDDDRELRDALPKEKLLMVGVDQPLTVPDDGKKRADTSTMSGLAAVAGASGGAAGG